MKDSWKSGDPYEYFMGRWSRLVAESFVGWLSPVEDLKWLDVGCGSGALSEAVIANCKPENITAIDQSEGFVNTAQDRLGSMASCRVGNALALPMDDSSVDITVSGLVLNFISEPEKALTEMKRVTDTGGTVAVYIWDYAGKMDFLNTFWDAAVELNPKVVSLHEGKRFPDANANALKDLFKKAGLTDVATAPLDISTHFLGFDDFWEPFLGGQGPAPTYVLSLDDTEREKLRDALHERLPIMKNGIIPLSARAWGVRGKV
jgi:ubiquinone/menaquinone biosynthesis C-methylase UbiE